MPNAANASARPAMNIHAALAFNADTARLPVEADAVARAMTPTSFSFARFVWGGNAFWWQLLLPLGGLIALLRRWRHGQRARGVALLAAAFATTILLACAGGWWYSGRR